MLLDENNSPWLKGLTSTGNRGRTYYDWKGKNFILKGERPDFRCKLLSKGLYGDTFKGKSVIDLGCNLGRMSQHALHLGASSVSGIEYDEKTTHAANKLAEIEGVSNVFKATTLDLAFHPVLPSYDIALCFSVLHHINPRKLAWKLLNDQIFSSIFIEEGPNEQIWGGCARQRNSHYTEEDAWKFSSLENMIKYISDNLPNFFLKKNLGLSEKNRHILIFERRKNG